MSKFCSKCGAELEENSAFCSACGEKIEATEAEVTNETVVEENAVVEEAPVATEAANAAIINKEALTSAANDLKDKGLEIANKVKGDKKLLGIVAGALALIIALCVICPIAFPGPKSAVKNYIKGNFNGDWKAYVDCRPDEVWEYLEEKYDIDMDEREEQFEDNWDDRLDDLEDEYGRNVKVTYKIVDKDEMDKDDLDDIRDSYKDTYDIAKRDITAGYELDVEVTIKGREDEDTEDATFYVFKLGGKWYVYNVEFDD